MDKNKKVGLWLLLLVAGMIGLSFASVPLFNLFCRTTGFDGTTQVAKQLPASDFIRDQTVTVAFSADTAPNMPWTFTAETKPFDLKLGEAGHAMFHVKNNSKHAVVGQAVYNVLPEKAGLYFQKLQCFCFEKHTLQAGEERDFPVLFFVDPSIADNPDTRDIKTITLHYTYFEAK